MATTSTSAGKSNCNLCRTSISKANWARHQRSSKHLHNWAAHEGINAHFELSDTKLLDIKEKIDNGFLDYGVYNVGRLRQLASDRGLEVAANLCREKLCRKLCKADTYRDNKLHLYTLEHIKQIARDNSIPPMHSSKEELIAMIYGKKGLSFCQSCKLAVQDRGLHDVSPEHVTKIGGRLEDTVEVSRSGNFQAFVINNIADEALDIPQFMESNQQKVLQFLERSRSNMKVYMTLECQYSRDMVVSDPQRTIMSFHTKAQNVFIGDDLNEIITSHFDDLVTREGQYQPNAGSGWSLLNVRRLIIRKAAVSPLSASSYIDLPRWVKAKRACINVQNKRDNFCFAYSVLCAVDEPSIHPERLYHYTERLNHNIFQGFDYPLAIKDIRKFENKSEEAIDFPTLAINVFEIGPGGKNRKSVSTSLLKDDIRPVIVSKRNRNAEKIIDLLLISNDETKHYVLIKNLSRLVRSQVTSHETSVVFCRQCLSHYYTIEKLIEHEQICYMYSPCTAIMPSPGNVVTFKNHVNKFPHPYIIYADFETMGVEHNETVGDNTRRVKKHVPYGFSIYRVSRVEDEEKCKPIVFRAKTPGQLKRTPKIFIKKLHQIVQRDVASKYQTPYPLVMSREDEEDFARATHCHICEEPFGGEMKVRDHSHLEGHYLGAAHVKCNLKRSIVTKIPVVLHNMSRFDSHLFIEPLFRYNDHSRLTIIPSTEETYITIQKNLDLLPGSDKYLKLCFIDSLRLLNSSLEKLASNLERNQFKHLSYFVENSVGKYSKMSKTRAFQILRRKGIFPYDFIDNLSKLDYSSLVEIEHFHNSLTGEGISRLDYSQYKFVWYFLKNKTLGAYSDLYNIQDVLLLADVFETFRDLCLATYELDPAYYLTAPSLAWDAMLKISKIKIELLSDVDMHLMVEKGIRGGIAQVCKRHVKANNRYLNDYDSSKPENFLMYLDACNLYGWALSQKLPLNSFHWIIQCPGPGGWENFIANHDINSSEGYYLEVDLEYPDEMHDPHRDLPFAPEHYKKKLCTTFFKKTKYVTHINNLQQMLANGLKLSKVHKVLGFHQEAFMKSYVDLNSEKRKNSRNEFETLFFKGMVNSVYGRTMMNLRKQQDIRLCTEEQAHKLLKRPSFSRWTMFSGNFLACHLAKNRIYFNQPIQIGCAVLELSKHLMYDFMYEKLKVWDPATNLVLMDTDSYLVEMSTDPYEIIRRYKDHFDTSSYPVVSEEHPLYGIHNQGNKNVPGKMKDELAGIPMSEVYGLRAKLYYYEYPGKHEIRAKGVKKCVAKRCIGKDHFRRALYDGIPHYTSQVNIRSKKHILYTERQTKLALNANDDKRMILPNKVDTLPWGHYSIFDPDTVDLGPIGNEIIQHMLEDSDSD